MRGVALAALVWFLCCPPFCSATEAAAATAVQRDVLRPDLRQWLSSQGGPIRIGVTSIPPQVFRNPDTGELTGLCMDFIREIEQVLGYRFEVVYYATWNAMMGAALLHDIDVVYAAQQTPSREGIFLFTEPYLTFNNKIVTTQDVSGPLTLEDLADKTVAVVSGAAIEEYLRLHYPKLRLLGVDDELVGLTRVSFKQADAMVIEIARASWFIQQNKFTNLHIAGDAGYVYRLGFACRSDRPEVAAILNAGLAQISPSRRTALINAWIFPARQAAEDIRFLVRVLTGAGIALLAALGANWLLSVQVRRRTAELRRELEAHQKDISAMKQYETIISLSDDFMAFVDTAYVYHAVNDAYLKAVNRTREQVIGHTMQEVFGKERFTLLIENQIRDAFRGKTVTFEQWAALETLGELFVHGVYHPHTNASGVLEGVVVVVHDITDIQKARQELLSREEQLRSLVAASPVGIGWAKDRMLLSVNQKICDITGYSESELVGQSSRMLYLTQKDFDSVGTEKYRQIEQFGIGTVETRWRRKDGTVIDVLLSSVPLDAAHREKGTTFTALDITDRKQAEQRYQLLFHEMLDGFALHEILCDETGVPHNYRFLAVNPAFERLTGLKADAIVGKTVLDVMPATEAIWISRYGQVALTGEPIHFEDRSSVLGRHFEVTAFCPAPRQFACIFSDVTERKRAETALEESRQAMYRLMGNLRGIAYRCGTSPDWPMEFISQGCEALSGYADHEFYSGAASWGKLIVEEDNQRIVKEIAAQLEKCEPFQIEYRIRDRAGQIKWFWEKGCGVYDSGGQVVALEGFITDITDRKAAEAAMQESEEKYRSLVDQAAEMLFVHDMEGRLVEVNLAAVKATGYSREELLQMTVYDIDPDAGARQDRRHVWESLSRFEPKTFEVQHKRKDGTIYWAEVRAGKLSIRGSEYIMALANDITERKQAEQAREQLLKELRSKNEELESIVFIASHDLRSPLVNIRGFAGELEKSFEEIKGILSEAGLDESIRQRLHTSLTADIPESLHFIKSSNKKMNTLLNGLLRLSRIGTAQINPTAIDMNALIGEILSGLHFKIRESNIDIAVDGSLPGCRGDFTLINQVFVNLVDNAIKYRHPDRPCCIRIRGSRENGRSVYQVEDNGIGIAPEYQDKVFDIFHQLNPGIGGEGLGLTIVRRVLERQDGHIQIRSAAGAGTILTVTLPGA